MPITVTTADTLLQPLLPPRDTRREALQTSVMGLISSSNVQVFCGMLARISQFSDILQDSRVQLDKVCLQAFWISATICCEKRGGSGGGGSCSVRL